MSASKDKKTRLEQRAAGTDKKRNAAAEQALSAQKFRRNAIIAVVCIVLVVAAALVINSDLFYTKLPAIRIGSTDYSAAEVNVFYRNTYSSIYESYGSLASYMIDTSKPLTQQQYSEEQTWADFLSERTIENMKQITALGDEAAANGYTLSDEDRATIDDQMAQIEAQASSSGAGSANQFLAAVYGKGVNTKIYRSVLERMVLAQSYATSHRDGLSYSDADCESYYTEHSDELDYVTYYTYFVSNSDDSFADLEDDAAKKAAAHEAAQSMAADNADDFTANVLSFSETATVSPTTQQGSALNSYSDSYGEWLLDSARKSGDFTVVDVDSGSYAVLFSERSDNDYATASMRHILIQTEADEDGSYSEEAKQAALVRLQEIEAEWQADPTEDHFAELANQYSEDSGSNTTGGLYENIARGQMVESIDDFLFAEGREPGDNAELYGQSSAYEGWHLVYFVGNGQSYRRYLAESALRESDYDTWIEGLVAGYDVGTGAGKNYVRLA